MKKKIKNTAYCIKIDIIVYCISIRSPDNNIVYVYKIIIFKHVYTNSYIDIEYM